MTPLTLALVLVSLLIVIVLVVLMRIYQIFKEMQQNRTCCSGGFLLLTKTTSTRPHRTKPCKTMVVLGSGGHTSEMLHMVRQLDASLYHPMIYVVASTDHTSVQRLEATVPPPRDSQKHCVCTIPRSREVGQSYMTSIGTTLHALIHSIRLTIHVKPDLLLCNGPGTCVPIVLGCWLLRIGGHDCKLVFCESYCRVQTLSLSGRLLYPMVDCFLVHWESLYQKYPSSYRLSTFVQKQSSSSATSSSSTSNQYQ